MGLLSTFALASIAPKNTHKTSPSGPWHLARKDSSLSTHTVTMIQDELLDKDANEESMTAEASSEEEEGPEARPEASAAPSDSNPLPRRWVPKKSKSLRRFGSFTTRPRANSSASEGDDKSTTSGSRRRPPLTRLRSRRSSLLSSADEEEVAMHQAKERPRPILRTSSVFTATDEGSFDELFSAETPELDSEDENPALDSAGMLASIGRNPTSHDLAKVAALRAHEYINEYLFSEDSEHCGIFDREDWERIPQYTKSEFLIRKHLGKGSFSDAFEVTTVIDDPNATKRLELNDKDDLDCLMEAKFANKSQDLTPTGRPHRGRRQTIDNHGAHASFCVRKTSTHTNAVPKVQVTYAMKCLRPQIRSDAEQFFWGVEDLVHETAMLATLDHPNIVKCHGRARCSSDSCLSDGYFILLDRLKDTLDDRIDRWKNEAVSRQPPSTSQLKVARSIADALAYLHSRDIVFRDLKPQNIGFDSAGVLKLFDFGFATKMKGQLNEICGTRRYMAPEVGLDRGYGMPADVHSFGILLWEICSLQRPYAKIKNVEEFDLVVFEKGARPTLSRHWNHSLTEVMTGCWNSFPGRRPDMETVKTMLDRIISEASSQQHRRQRSNNDPLNASLRKSLLFRRQSQW